MSSSYYLSVFDNAGNQLERFADFISLESRQQVNIPGYIEFVISADHASIANINHFTLIKLYRKNTDVAMGWTLENYGLVLSREWSYDPLLGYVFKVIAVHPLWLLSTRHVAWKAGSADRSKFTAQPAETIAKSLVLYNITSTATIAAGRECEGSYTAVPVTTQADAATGASLEWFCAYQNLLETLQQLSIVGGGDFNLVPSGSGYEFRWYNGQLGIDRSASVLFSSERGNLANAVYTFDRREEKTVAIIGGQGEGSLRMVAIRQGLDYNEDDNVLEGFVYAVNTVTFPGLQAQGDRYLLKKRAVPKLTFDVIQTASQFYGLHYFVGDLVTVRNPYTLVDTVCKVADVLISLKVYSPEVVKIYLEPAGQQEISDLDDQVNVINTTDNMPNDTLDGQFFTTTDYNFALDADLFTASYLADDVSGGDFAPYP
jgi:hypothetical protein